MWIIRAIAVGVSLLALPVLSRAKDFYQGRTVTIVVGLSPGGGYDTYARFLAKYLGTHIAGHPTVIVQNQPGAATATATQYVYRVAPQNGTYIGMSLNTLPIYQAVFPEKVHFDMKKVQFLGNMATQTSVIAMSNRSPIKSVEDMTKHSANLGSDGFLSETYIIPEALNALAGAKFKVITGYPGAAEMDLAIERGELDGRGGVWDSFQEKHPDWIKEGKIFPILQIGADPDPTMPNVPQLISLAKTRQQRSIFNLLSSIPRFSRAFWVGPAVPSDRVAVLRNAFRTTMADPAFVRYARDHKLEISPTYDVKLALSLRQIGATSTQDLKVLRHIMH